MDIMLKCQESMKQRKVIHITTDNPDEWSFTGVVSMVGRDIVIIHNVQDSGFDGAVVIPKRVIKGYRDGAFESFANNDIHWAGYSRAGVFPKWLNKCNSLYEVFGVLQKRAIWSGVDAYCARNAAKYVVGPILDVDRRNVTMKCYDGAGVYDGDLIISYSQVVYVDIGCKYCERFSAYMKDQLGDAVHKEEPLNM